MSKPNDFRETYVLAADVPYHAASKSTNDTYASQGMLRQGRIVWLQGTPDSLPESVAAYAEGVGVVHVTSDLLVPMSSI